MSGPVPLPINVSYVVVAGGGAGGGGNGWGGGGGGAGGYRSSVTGENSGGGVSAEPPLTANAGESFAVKVGAGGSNGSSSVAGRGNDSQFGPVVSIGGGRSRRYDGGTQHIGGSGGGGMELFTEAGVGLVGQGFAGSGGIQNGGGGAGGAGSGTTGGAGVASSVTGSSVTRAVGGNGNSSGSGTTNRGNGGAGSRNVGSIGSGGSGVVIVRVATGTQVAFSGGVSQTSATVGTNTVYTITAAGPTDTVTIG